jgi:hypothetical protein
MIAAFAMVVLVGGHGIGPVGLMLFLGWRGWMLPNLVGWLAIALLIGGLVARDPEAGLDLRRISGTCFGIAWLLFAAQSEYFGITLLTSLPFLACLIGWAVAVWPRKDAPIQ